MYGGYSRHIVMKEYTLSLLIIVFLQEFVHSDDGRTVPSLGSLLGCTAEILQLDVAELHMDFLK